MVENSIVAYIIKKYAPNITSYESCHINLYADAYASSEI